jgi:hypothetical protein
MTFQAGGKISIGDINGYGASNPYNIDMLWGTGSNDYGYGLKMILAEGETAYTSFPQVTAGQKIRKVHWGFVSSQIPTIAAHQGTTLPYSLSSLKFGVNTNNGDLPEEGYKIAADSTVPAKIDSNIQALYTNRLNAAFQSPYTIGQTASMTSSWSDKFVATFTVNFGSSDGARYFFNNGGQIAINSGHGTTIANTINNLISDLCADAGTLIISSPTSTSPNSGIVTISGITYNGVKKVGGSGSAPRSVIADANYGFYYFHGSSYTANTKVTLHTQYSDQTYVSGGTDFSTSTVYKIEASYDKAGTMTITVTIDEVPNGKVVQAGTYSILTLRQPANNFSVGDNWTTPTITSSTSLSA